MHVLFVDDEPQVLEGLRDLLWPHRKRWRVSVALGARKALEMLRKDDAQVVVSDIQMPEMDGVELLEAVKRDYPAALRVMLSGQCGLDAGKRAVSVAQQYLSKPCSPEALVDTLERAERYNALLTDQALIDVVGRCDRMPSPPTLYARLTSMAGDPNVELHDLASVVQTDPAITAKLLQLANSSFFGRAKRTVTATEAIQYLGVKLLADLVLMSEVAISLECAGCPLDIDAFQAHALSVAWEAHRHVGAGDAGDAAFTAGLLHDIGELVIACGGGDADDDPLLHAGAGAYLLARWGLPIAIVDAVACHHDEPSGREPAGDIIAAVQLAERQATPVEGCG